MQFNWFCDQHRAALDFTQIGRVRQVIRNGLVHKYLQHTATHCNTLQHTAKHCSTLQHTASHCNRRQHTATHCNMFVRHVARGRMVCCTVAHCSTLQHTAAHCNTLQHTATHYNTLQHTATRVFVKLSALG